MAGVQLQALHRRFGDVVALDGIDLDIARGEFVSFLGPSGCGKTTALRMIAGLETISSGEIYIGDTLVNDMAPKDRDIAMVFQSYALYPHMTVRENLEFGLKLRKTPKAEMDRVVNEAAEILGIKHLLDRKPKQLSGGQRQRVALGRAMVRDFPEYLHYWNIPAIKFGKKVMRNTNSLIGRYNGADGGKTGFICASGFNVMASATRNGRRLIAVVLGSPSSPVRTCRKPTS